MENIKILFVDDMDFSQILFKATIKNLDYLLTQVYNGKEAIEKLETDTYDIVFMDIEMPEMSGIEAAEHIRTQMPDPVKSIPIIAVTGHKNTDYLNDLKNYYFTDHISKIFDSNDIQRIIEQYTGKSKSYQLKFKDHFPECNHDLEKTLISYFIQHTPNAIADIYNAINQNDKKLLKDICHKLSNQLNYFGLINAAKLTDELEVINMDLYAKQDLIFMVGEIEKDSNLAIKELKKDFEL